MSKKWYVLHTYSGYENKVKTNLEIRVETMGLENNVFAIEIRKLIGYFDSIFIFGYWV